MRSVKYYRFSPFRYRSAIEHIVSPRDQLCRLNFREGLATAIHNGAEECVVFMIGCNRQSRAGIDDNSALEYLYAALYFIGESNTSGRELSANASVPSYHVAEEEFGCCRCFGSVNSTH